MLTGPLYRSIFAASCVPDRTLSSNLKQAEASAGSNQASGLKDDGKPKGGGAWQGALGVLHAPYTRQNCIIKHNLMINKIIARFAERPHVTLTGMRVLVVDDEAITLMLMEDFLKELGCAVAGSAVCLKDALEKARSLTVDVALLDVNLAGETSYPVADILRERNIPFVFATGYGIAGLPNRFNSTAVLAKPFQQTQLACALREAIGEG
jgi:CheY-like chemotaxis protein